MITSRKKSSRRIDFSLEELSEVERELIRAVEELDAGKELTIRLARIISSKMQLCRQYVKAQQLLERWGDIELVD